jgi:hypothetical protein
LPTFWDEEDGDGEPEREPWRGDEWIPAEQKWRKVLRARLPETRHASLVHFEMAWAGLRLEDLARKHGRQADRKPCNEWSKHELRRFLPAMLEAMERRDETLFRDLARLSKSLFQPECSTNEERVLQAALELREAECANPTRAAVKRLVLSGGVKIDERDWSRKKERGRARFQSEGRSAGATGEAGNDTTSPQTKH